MDYSTQILYTLPEHLRGFLSVWKSLPEEEQTIPLLTAKILNEEIKNDMFKPQDLDIEYNTTSSKAPKWETTPFHPKFFPFFPRKGDGRGKKGNSM